jgi:hypothetical protein
MKKFTPKRTLIKGDSFLINHPDSDPELMGTQYIGKDSWLYKDKSEHALVLKIALRWGFDLPTFDTWLENLEPCAAKDELIERRVSLINLSSQALKGGIEFIKLRHEMIARDEVVIPLARARIEHLKTQKKNSSQPRSSNAVRDAVMKEMSVYKKADYSLQDFLNGAVQGSIVEIEAIEIVNPKNPANPIYCFTAMVAEGMERARPLITIRNWWTDCDKKKKILKK